MMIIAISVDSHDNTLLMDPVIYNRGVIQINIDKTIESCKLLVKKSITSKLNSKTNFAELKTIIKEVAGDYIYSKTHRHPMIIPVIMKKG